MVITRLPSVWTASVKHERTRRPSTSTVQAPHWPWSQPFLVPVSPSRSRSASSSETLGSTSSAWSVPLMVSRTRIPLRWAVTTTHLSSNVAGEYPSVLRRRAEQNPDPGLMRQLGKPDTDRTALCPSIDRCSHEELIAYYEHAVGSGSDVAWTCATLPVEFPFQPAEVHSNRRRST